MAVLWVWVAWSGMLCIVLAACTSASSVGGQWRAAASSREARGGYGLDGGVQRLEEGQGRGRASGASRAWSGSTGLARVRGRRHVDPGAGRRRPGR